MHHSRRSIVAIAVSASLVVAVPAAAGVASPRRAAPVVQAGRAIADLASDSRAKRPGAATSSAASASVQASVAGTPLLPAAGSVFTGVSPGPVGEFTNEVGKHPAVYGEFVTWGQSIHYAFNNAAAAHARLMLHISTTQGYGAAQVITPAGIAQGAGDGYLVSLSKLIASYGKPVYIRLLPEMNQANNAYCAFNTDGSSRGPAYAPSEFIAAWRRVVTVLRGGSVAAIDTQLQALGETPLHGVGAGGSIASSPVSFVWTPQVAGSPDTPANSPAAYYPGDSYVDWVGTDFYSRFPNFTGLDAFYKQHPHKPFAFGEWALWGGDNPGFVDQLFSWVNSHKRVQMMLYNQGYTTDGPLRLNLDPASAAAIRRLIAAPRFLAATPEW
jgi:hypothetical protein